MNEIVWLFESRSHFYSIFKNTAYRNTLTTHPEHPSNRLQQHTQNTPATVILTVLVDQLH